MIIYTNKNLFLSPAQTLVNTVNTVGVMGKGIAKNFIHKCLSVINIYVIKENFNPDS